jgi:hypothetical protein
MSKTEETVHKGKVVPVLKQLSTAIREHMGSGGIAPPFLTSTLDGGEWSASRPGSFIRREKAARYPLDRRLGGPQSRSGRRGEEKSFDPTVTRTLTPRSSSQ